MKYFLPLLGLALLSACTISPRRGRSGQLAPEREMMHPDHFPTDSMQPDTLR
ncbi:hypothetical protein [Hymenobacter actinosclerus]|uniref:Lipoprotein n=1 Tax=Hymenobacter actinosclerus TaxID=82805 RepID=A0A1I0FI20_9BACT|nr:hypothetical protein [Hymenobacter actinosclerus]SET57800.1 hypothetical protein SAMN04487998_2282 [Hymenobacter actinosclerus]